MGPEGDKRPNISEKLPCVKGKMRRKWTPLFTKGQRKGVEGSNQENSVGAHKKFYLKRGCP